MAAGFATVTEEDSSGGKASGLRPPSPEELGRYFPQLEIIELLGRGGMGAVYKARQKELDRIVAVKILPPDIGLDRAFSERFTREAKALAKLNHPHIVTLYDFGQADGLFYFFMEYVDGMNLRQLLNGKHISPDEALAIVPQICDALQFAHDRGVVHRDIKPENILLGKNGQVKIADFGVAKIVAGNAGDSVSGDANASAPQMTETGRVLGTPEYMAPEQASHPLEVDHRADIYSLGVVFYQMLTGELPGKRIELPSKKIRIDVRLDEVVLRALEENPDLRYQQASLFKTGVETIASTAPQASSTPLPPSERAVRRVAAPRKFPHEEVYAGFWKRAVALIIDYSLVSVLVFPLILIIATVAPDRIVVSVPFGLFTKERVIETHKGERKHSDGSITIEEYRLVEVSPLGKWTYLYKEQIDRKGGEEKTSRTLIDPTTKRALPTTSTEKFNLWVLLFYWVLMESSGLQASFGKSAMHIRVVDKKGRRLSLLRAFGRNVSKILSLVTLTFGFMMAGWTRKKQALHDMVADCCVVRGNSPPVGALESPPSGSRNNKRLSVAGKVSLLLLVAVTLPWLLPTCSERRLQRMQSEVRAHAEGTQLSVGASQARSHPTSKRRRFVPKEGMADKTSWGLETEPSEINPPGCWTVRAWMALGGVVTASAPNEERVFCEIKLVSGDDDKITLHIKNPEEKNTMTVTLNRDYPVEISINGAQYQLLFPSVYVATTEEDTYPFANVFLVHQKAKDTESKPVDLEPIRIKAWPGDLYSVNSDEYDLEGLRGRLNKMALDQSKHRQIISLTLSAAKGVDETKAWIITDAIRASGINTPEVLAGNPLRGPVSHVKNPRFQLRSEVGDQVKDAETFNEANGVDKIRLGKEVLLDEGDVASASVITEEDGRRQIRVKFTESGTRKFAAITGSHHNRRVAFLFDGRVLMAPMIKDTIFGGEVTILGSFPEAVEKALIEALNAHRAVPPSSQLPVEKAVKEPPQLRALNWQDWIESGSSEPWLPSGGGIPGSDWMPAHAGLDTSTMKHTAETPRFLALWFSHPLFDKQSVAEVTLLDVEGKAHLETPVEGRLAGRAIGHIPASIEHPETGWITATLCAGSIENSPSDATVSLRYSLGPWEFCREIAPDYRGGYSLGNGVMLGAMGQDAEKGAFVQFTRDSSLDAGSEQFDFVAILRDGRRLERSGWQQTGAGKVLMERLAFATPLAQVKTFEVRKRPVLTFTKVVVLRTSPLPNEKMAISFDRGDDSMSAIARRFQVQYGVRLCMEDLDFDAKKDAITLGQLIQRLGAKERDGTLRESEKQRLKWGRQLKGEGRADNALIDVGERYTGVITATSVPMFLEELTKGTPYDFKQFGETWVIMPRGYSRLAFPVTLKTEGLTVDAATQAILKQHPGPGSISSGMAISGPIAEGTDPFPWLSVKLPELEISNISALEALCKITEAARPDSVWALAGYKDHRLFSLIRGPGWENEVIGYAQAWLLRMDRGEYAKSWQESSGIFKSVVSEAQWVKDLTIYRRPLGEVKSRRLRKTENPKSLPGVPDGQYLVMEFESSFTEKKEALETVTFMQEVDGRWRGVGYFIK